MSGRSIGTNGGGLAFRLSSALGRVVFKHFNNMPNTSQTEQPEDDDEISEIVTLVNELNQSTDLTHKLNSQSKIIKYLENKEELN